MAESYIDTRDLAQELDTLEAAFSDWENGNAYALDWYGTLAEVNDRINALRELRDQVGDEWPYGATLIPEADFEDYARELADDLGVVPGGVSNWPLTCIDWEQAAIELSQDYSLVEFDGQSYYVRAR